MRYALTTGCTFAGGLILGLLLPVLNSSSVERFERLTSDMARLSSEVAALTAANADLVATDKERSEAADRLAKKSEEIVAVAAGQERTLGYFKAFQPKFQYNLTVPLDRAERLVFEMHLADLLLQRKIPIVEAPTDPTHGVVNIRVQMQKNANSQMATVCIAPGYFGASGKAIYLDVITGSKVVVDRESAEWMTTCNEALEGSMNQFERRWKAAVGREAKKNSAPAPEPMTPMKENAPAVST